MRTILIAGLILLFGGYALALPIDIKILPGDEIARLTDAQLVDTYADIFVELETAKTFYGRAGFQPKEVKEFKKLIRYRLDILMEFHKRKIKPPKFE